MIKFRPHRKSDIVYRVKWLNNPRVNKYIGDQAGKKTTFYKQTKWFEKYLGDQTKKFFTICDDSLPIGCVGLCGINKKDGQAEAFIMVGDDNYCHRGIGKKALKYIINYGFRKIGLQKITLGVFERNRTAKNCFKSVGFEVVSKLRSDFLIDEKRYNTILMSISRK